MGGTALWKPKSGSPHAPLRESCKRNKTKDFLIIFRVSNENRDIAASRKALGIYPSYAIKQNKTVALRCHLDRSEGESRSEVERSKKQLLSRQPDPSASFRSRSTPLGMTPFSVCLIFKKLIIRLSRKGVWGRPLFGLQRAVSPCVYSPYLSPCQAKWTPPAVISTEAKAKAEAKWTPRAVISTEAKARAEAKWRDLKNNCSAGNQIPRLCYAPFRSG